MASSLHADEGGAVFVEFAAVFSLLLVVTLGLVDLGLLMFTWADADRATQRGARYAVTSSPVADGINGPVAGKDGAANGTPCAAATCVLRPRYDCTANAGSGGTCTGSDGTTKSVRDELFDDLVAEMNENMYARQLDRRQVAVSYVPLMQGYVGRPGTPMNVTVSLRCVKQELFFVDAIFGWIFPPLPPGCEGLPDSGIPLTFSTTLPSEDLTTN